MGSLLTERQSTWVRLRRIAVFFSPGLQGGWEGRGATESGRKGDRERKPEVWRDREEDTVQAEGCHIWEQREGVKEADMTLGRNRCPGIKKPGSETDGGSRSITSELDGGQKSFLHVFMGARGSDQCNWVSISLHAIKWAMISFFLLQLYFSSKIKSYTLWTAFVVGGALKLGHDERCYRTFQQGFSKRHFSKWSPAECTVDFLAAPGQTARGITAAKSS